MLSNSAPLFSETILTPHGNVSQTVGLYHTRQRNWLCNVLGTYIQANDVTAEVELPLFDDMDGPRLLLLHLNHNTIIKTLLTSMSGVFSIKRQYNSNVSVILHLTG